MLRVYRLDMLTLPALRAAALARWLPDGSMVWRAIDAPQAWSMETHLLASLVDQIQLWMWGMSDKRKRGPKPKPLPRPGTRQKTRQTSTQVQAMSVEELDRFMSRQFTDQ